MLGCALAYATTDWDLDGRLLAASVLGVAVLYGMGIEFGQSLVPDRYFSLNDAYANALGGVLVGPYYRRGGNNAGPRWMVPSRVSTSRRGRYQ